MTAFSRNNEKKLCQRDYDRRFGIKFHIIDSQVVNYANGNTIGDQLPAGINPSTR